jgi:hypothetical protein
MKKYRPSPTRPRPTGYPCIKFDFWATKLKGTLHNLEGGKHRDFPTPVVDFPSLKFPKGLFLDCHTALSAGGLDHTKFILKSLEEIDSGTK